MLVWKVFPAPSTGDDAGHGSGKLYEDSGEGLGYQDADFRAFGVEKRHRVGRFEEGIEVLRQAWTGERFSFSGRHFDIDDVCVLPLPIQRPGTPLWIGGWVLVLGTAICMWPSHAERLAMVAERQREEAVPAGSRIS